MGWSGIAIGVIFVGNDNMGECIHVMLEGVKWIWARCCNVKKP
jgi:hypothetical protein